MELIYEHKELRNGKGIKATDNSGEKINRYMLSKVFVGDYYGK